MRVKGFSITNFRSIKEISDFNFYDSSINCLVGGNGSGKSSILDALAVFNDTSKISEDDFYNIRRHISIGLTIDFEDKDNEVLQKYTLDTSKIKGFLSILTVKLDGTTDRKYEAIGTFTEIEDPRAPLISQLKSQIKDMFGDTGSNELLSQIDQLIDYSGDEYGALLNTITEKVNENVAEVSLKDLTIETINKLRESEKPDINKLFGELSSSIRFVKLNPDEYQVESVSPINELNNREQHQFIHDLLLLGDEEIVETTFRQSVIGWNEAKKELGKSISNKISEVWKSHPIKISIERENGDNDIFFLLDITDSKSIKINMLSEGEKWLLKFFSKISQFNEENLVILVDEPGKSLHTTSQKDLLKFLLSQTVGHQVIYTTHQPMMTPWHNLEKLYYIKNEKPNGTSISTRFWKDEEFESPLRGALTLFVGEELFSKRRNIIVEGVSDYFFLLGWARFFTEQETDFIKDDDLAIVPAGSINNMPLYMLFLTQKTKNKCDILVITDKDDEEEAIVNKQIDDNGLSLLKGRVFNIEQLCEKKPFDKYDIEDIFTVEEYYTEFEENYKDSDLKLPKLTEVKKLVDGSEDKRITKALEQLLVKNNPKADNPHLDKTGISQQVFTKLIGPRSSSAYSNQTKEHFKKLIEKIGLELKS